MRSALRQDYSLAWFCYHGGADPAALLILQSASVLA